MTVADHEGLHAYVDGELDAMAAREFENRLEADEALAARLRALRELRRNVAESAAYHAAPASLRARVAAIGSSTGRSRRADRSPAFAWPGWRPFGASLALVACAAVGLDVWRDTARADERLGDEVIASHVRATLGEHLVDVASSDHHTVKPWLSSKLDFSPPVPEAPLAGTPFVGGRVDYLAGRPVAALVFRHGNHVVESFVWPVDARDRAVAMTSERGFQVARWTQAGMTHWTISDVNRTEFEAIVRQLAAAR